MKKFICIFLSLWVLMSSCFAFDGDSLDYYTMDSLSPLTASALDYAVMPLSATSWDTADQAHLAAIRNALTSASTLNGGSVFGWVQLIGQTFKNGLFTDILNEIGLVNDAFRLNVSANEGSLLDSVRDIELALTGTPSVASGSVVDNILNLAVLPEIKSDTQKIEENTNYLDDILSEVTSIDTAVGAAMPYVDDIAIYGERQNTLTGSLSNFLQNKYDNQYYVDGSLFNWRDDIKGFIALSSLHLTHDGIDTVARIRTLYSRIAQLQEVLASDDDLALANSQKANREEIESEFLTGSSGSTSLGVSDFGDLADVGGTLKDSLSLDGNATIGSFTSGLTAADTAGQGWFSETTRSQLDAVSSTVTYSLRDPDPYNMSGWEDRYYWLLGDAYD